MQVAIVTRALKRDRVCVGLCEMVGNVFFGAMALWIHFSMMQC
jgi:hypothetical protein